MISWLKFTQKLEKKFLHQLMNLKFQIVNGLKIQNAIIVTHKWLTVIF